jgi:hypothetical protein
MRLEVNAPSRQLRNMTGIQIPGYFAPKNNNGKTRLQEQVDHFTNHRPALEGPQVDPN